MGYSPLTVIKVSSISIYTSTKEIISIGNYMSNMNVHIDSYIIKTIRNP